MVNVVCDACKRSFKIVPRVEALSDGGERHWFRCPRCKRRYSAGHVTARGVKLRAPMREVRRRIRALAPDADIEREGLLGELESLREMMGREVTA